MTKLPDKPSELIRLALADLEKVEASKEYVVTMSRYHEPNGAHGSRRCQVCFAGAVIASTLGMPPEIDAFPESFDRDTALKLFALNEFRQGWVSEGLGFLVHLGYRGGHDSRIVTPYHVDPKQFKSDMHEIATELEGKGQ